MPKCGERLTTGGANHSGSRKGVSPVGLGGALCMHHVTSFSEPFQFIAGVFLMCWKESTGLCRDWHEITGYRVVSEIIGMPTWRIERVERAMRIVHLVC